MINQDVKKTKNTMCFFSCILGLFFLCIFFFPFFKNWENQKKTFESKPNILSTVLFFGGLLVLLQFFVFLGLSIDSHDCRLCPYACLPYRSWEVKL